MRDKTPSQIAYEQQALIDMARIRGIRRALAQYRAGPELADPDYREAEKDDLIEAIETVLDSTPAHERHRAPPED